MNYIAIPGLKRTANFKRSMIGRVIHLGTSDKIIRIVEEHFGVTIDQLRSKTRQRRICYPRHVAMYAMYKRTTLSLSDIGAIFGGRDHTTTIHAKDSIEDLMAFDSDINLEVQTILSKI